jgi:hypothetical protein
MTLRSEERDDPEYNDVTLIVAGAADAVLSSVASALETAAALLRRGDRAALAQHGIDELKARGRLALARRATAAPAYLEVLAQHVETSRGLHND